MIGGVEGRLSDEYSDGYIILTNFRLIWISYSASATTTTPFDGIPCHIPLGSIAQTELSSSFLHLKPSKLKLQVRLDAADYPSSDALRVARMSKMVLVIKNSSEANILHDQLDMALSRKVWTVAPPGLLQQMHTHPPANHAVHASSYGPMTPPLGVPPSYGNPMLINPSNIALVSSPVTPGDISAMTAQLQSMGFTETASKTALARTNNAGIQQAIDWLVDNALTEAAATTILDGGGHDARDSPLQYTTDYYAVAATTTATATALFSAAVEEKTATALFNSDKNRKNPQEQKSIATPPPPPRPAASVGIAGLLHREERKAAERERVLSTAFTDLQQLMSHAQQMVALAEYFRQRAAHKQNPGITATGTSLQDDGEEMDDVLATELADLGIASPVTRETTGKLYYQELSRQLAAFIEGPVISAGGMMPVPDAYRQFCRARFTDLVSPDDLIQAMKKFPEVGAPLRLRKFASGVKVVQSLALDDASMGRRLVELAVQGAPLADADDGTVSSVIDTSGCSGDSSTHTSSSAETESFILALGRGVTHAEVAHALGVSITVAQQHIAQAESKGLLCRDEGGAEGVRFYKNFFDDVTVNNE